MRIYDSSNIRNIGILGHSGSGKSNMVEGLEFTAGLTNRIVGNENDTKITSSLSLHAVEYQGAKYNCLWNYRFDSRDRNGFGID